MQKINFNSKILENAPVRKVKKGEVLLRNGDVATSIFFVLKGCLRSFIVDAKGKEHIFMFAPEDWIVGDLDSLVHRLPSVLYIDAIENSVVRVLNIPEGTKASDLDKASLDEMNEKYRKRISALQSRIIQLLSASAEERYSSFNETYPQLAQRVPQKMIASYLGITPESLSRVRKNLIKKE